MKVDVFQSSLSFTVFSKATYERTRYFWMFACSTRTRRRPRVFKDDQIPEQMSALPKAVRLMRRRERSPGQMLKASYTGATVIAQFVRSGIETKSAGTLQQARGFFFKKKNVIVCLLTPYVHVICWHSPSLLSPSPCNLKIFLSPPPFIYHFWASKCL